MQEGLDCVGRPYTAVEKGAFQYNVCGLAQASRDKTPTQQTVKWHPRGSLELDAGHAEIKTRECQGMKHSGTTQLERKLQKHSTTQGI